MFRRVVHYILRAFGRPFWDDVVRKGDGARTVAMPGASPHVAFTSACTYCGKQGVKLQLCSACKRSRYCSKECQKAAWPEHKTVCRS